ncbi:glycosyltransferase family 2 protein [Chitinophaga sancti]|uniref:Glycosyl transferase family 2 n=1 Tax=Chitinophaga sancti TaxID=1004 RepID=A0A1K1Q8P4_9BACT|nr:glycosyltransferase [Chitinophaga sancti]WQD61230.1 glycosyltransferase [Chitinophaga sancti]WQG86643.1 glycosyltransferase [Chitinophaga sancti]SFW56093.1 Glycosyl transferase family 2 [Chitinophaga sancti]
MKQLNRIPDQPPAIKPLASATQRPVWSVMIPTYNCSHYLEATLKSVLDQDPGPALMQIEVVDDCSTDGDIAALVARIGQGRVSFYQQPENRGSLRNFETCLNRAKGHFVHLLHGDDLSGQGIYQEAARLFEEYPHAGAICTGFSYINEQGIEINKSRALQAETGIIKDWLAQIATGQKMQPPAVLVRRSVYEQLGGFFGIHYGEDWEMWVRIAANFPVVYTPDRLAYYRVHTSNITSRYFLSCQHIMDIAKVIELIQPYLPADERSRLKRQARYNWSLYFARTTDMTYHKYNAPAQALNQAGKAFRMHQNKVTFFFFCKILLKIMLRYKQ